MAFAASFGHGIRQGALRTSSRSPFTASIRLGRYEARSFSSLLLTSTSSSRTLAHIQPVGSSRGLSLWGSKSTPPPPAASEPAPVETAKVEETIPEATSTSGSVVDSSASAEASAFPTDGLTAGDLPVDGSVLSDVTEAVATHAPAALQYGDLAAMGLVSWNPAGLVRWSLELINVSTGMSWFWTLVVGSMFWRAVCIPFAIKGLQASARIQPHQKELAALQNEIKKVAEKKDPMAMKLASVKMQQFYKDHNVNPLGGMISVIQMPITLGVFFGVQTLCGLPLEQLHVSGISFLPDLTAVDSTYILPMALFALINTQIAVGARDINTIERPDMGHFLNLFRILSIPGIFFMSNFPAGLLVSLMTTSILSTAQSFILRMASVRAWLNIPNPPRSAQGRLPSLADTFRRAKSWFTDDFNSKIEKARQEAIKRQQSARQPPRRL